MGDLEREEIFEQITEVLDNIEEIVEDNEVDVDTDEQFIEIMDLVSRIRAITAEE